jgi:heme exporter protein C
MEGHGAKSLIFHLPCAWLTTLAYVLATIYAIRSHLKFKRGDYTLGLELDRKCGASMEIGFVYAILTTVTGSLFAYNEWQSFWNWDPRETSIVVLLLMMAAYLVLRGSVDNPERRARLSNAYVIITLIPAQFLIFVLPRIIFSLHPSNVVVSGQITGTYRLVIYGLVLPASLFVYCWIVQIRVRLMRLEAAAAQPLQ